MDDNSNVLKQFEGMPGVANNTNASTVPTAASAPSQAPAPVAPQKSVEEIRAELAKPTPPTVAAPVVKKPAAPTGSASGSEFKAIVPDPIFARTGLRTLEQDMQENNISLETLGRNFPGSRMPQRPTTASAASVAPTRQWPQSPQPAPRTEPAPDRTGIAEVFSSIRQTPDVPPAPTAASAFRAATETPVTLPRMTTMQSESVSPAAPEKKSDEIQSLRTYERDVADSIRGGQTVMSINRAEQKRKEERHEIVQATEMVAQNGLKTIVSVVLIFAALGTFGIIFFIGKQQTPVTPAVVVRTIISVDATQEIKPTATNRAAIISAAQAGLKNLGSNQSLNEIALIDTGLVNTATKKISANTFFKSVATNIPAALIRAFGDEWLFGFQALKKNEPFLIVSVSAFDNAYSGMLLWEKNISTDLRDIFLTNNTMQVPIVVATSTTNKTATTTATSTTPKIVETQIPLKTQFEDLIVKNRDTRVLRNEQGNIVLLYSFIDTKYVAITTNEETFREIITRYLATGLVR